MHSQTFVKQATVANDDGSDDIVRRINDFFINRTDHPSDPKIFMKTVFNFSRCLIVKDFHTFFIYIFSALFEKHRAI